MGTAKWLRAKSEKNGQDRSEAEWNMQKDEKIDHLKGLNGQNLMVFSAKNGQNLMVFSAK